MPPENTYGRCFFQVHHRQNLPSQPTFCTPCFRSRLQLSDELASFRGLALLGGFEGFGLGWLLLLEELVALDDFLEGLPRRARGA